MLAKFAFSLILILVITGCSKDDTEPVVSPNDTESSFDASVLPERFVEFKQEGAGVSFYYPENWGTVQINGAFPGVFDFTFGSNLKNGFAPKLTLVTPAYQNKDDLLYRQFNVGPQDDCDFFMEENPRLVEVYTKMPDAEQPLVELLTKNNFNCEVKQISGTPALLSYNPLRLEPVSDTEQIKPVPIPAVEYRLIASNNETIQSLNASMIIFGAADGTTYLDYKNNNLDPARQQALGDFELMMESLQLTDLDSEKIKAITPNGGKRKRPTTNTGAGLQAFVDHELIRFTYPKDWVVNKIVENVIEIATADRAKSNVSPQVRIKLLANANRKPLLEFIKTTGEFVIANAEDTNQVIIDDITWFVFKDFDGVYNLDVYFAAIDDKVVEIDALAASEDGYDPQIDQIVSSLRFAN